METGSLARALTIPPGVLDLCAPEEPSVGLRCRLLAFRVVPPDPGFYLAYVVIARPTLPISVCLNMLVGCRGLPTPAVF